MSLNHRQEAIQQIADVLSGNDQLIAQEAYRHGKGALITVSVAYGAPEEYRLRAERLLDAEIVRSAAGRVIDRLHLARNAG